MKRTSSLVIQKLNRRQLIWLVVIALALYVLLPQLLRLHGQLPSLDHINFAYAGLAVIAISGTYLAAAATYCLLAFRDLSYSRTFLMQLVATFANRLLPAGLGNLGVNFVYLRQQGHNRYQAASVLTVNNALGMIGHGVWLIIALVLWPSGLAKINLRLDLKAWWWLAVAVLILLLAWFWQRYRRRLQLGWQAFVKQLWSYRRRRGRLVGAVLTSMSLTLCNWLALWLCLKAFGLDLDPLRVFVVLSLGIAAGTATPTPGGLGGAEAGLLAGLLAMHAAYAPALAAVLLYRLIYYWLPLLAGAGAFALARQQGYLSLKY